MVLKREINDTSGNQGAGCQSHPNHHVIFFFSHFYPKRFDKYLHIL